MTPAETWLRLALGLSAREFDVTLRICRDMSEVDIGKELGISPHTVHSHMRRIFRKLGVGSRCQLVLTIAAIVLRSCESPCCDCRIHKVGQALRDWLPGTHER